ncbi:MAG: ABC transporter ATP-binding protein [Acidisphaera sp.]|nr:ABC transporter ATP-binding protein [Acidisphaera sp.]
MSDPAALITVDDLRTIFRTGEEVARAVDGVSFSLRAGETLALVGESGSGKSVTALSIMRLLPMPPAQIVGRRIVFADRGTEQDLLTLTERQMRRIRGRRIAMVFQEPMSSLNPLLTIGEQIAEGLRLHLGLSRAAAAERACELLARVNIPDPVRRSGEYPHRLSGGMRQRVMIAAALGCNPALLIADEPTTALDVTIQGQILELLRSLQQELCMAMLFVTHDLGVVSEVADRVAVMYAGRIVETGSRAEILSAPRHPYTKALLGSVPRRRSARRDPAARLPAIPGQVPSAAQLPPGCTFAPRCGLAIPACTAARPALQPIAGAHAVRCIRWRET